jgi:hypothetical protein
MHRDGQWQPARRTLKMPRFNVFDQQHSRPANCVALRRP